MFCKNCGNKISEEIAFCTECGHPMMSKNNTAYSANQTSTSLSEEEQQQASYYPLLIEQAKKTANVEMAKGIGWAVLGLVITFVTYAMAEDGGTYFILWGLVIYGVYIFLRGLFWRISPKSLVKRVLEARAEKPDTNKEK